MLTQLNCAMVRTTVLCCSQKVPDTNTASVCLVHTHLLQCPASLSPTPMMSDPSCLKAVSSCGRWSCGQMLGL